MSNIVNSGKEAVSRWMTRGENQLNNLANKMGDAIDKNLNKSTTRRGDMRKFSQAWTAFNDSITKFFAENCQNPIKDMEDELAQYGGVDEDDGNGPNFYGSSAKSASEIQREKDYL